MRKIILIGILGFLMSGCSHIGTIDKSKMPGEIYYKLSTGQEITLPLKYKNLQRFPVKPIYVPHPLGVAGIVGQRECPLNFEDENDLRKLAVLYFEEQKLSIIFDKGSESLAIVIAIFETKESSKFVAYKARFDIKTFPLYPTQGPDECDILFAINRISGKVQDGKRDLADATYSDDDITQGLMDRIRAFASNAEKRPPRSNSDTFFRKLFRGK